MIASAGRISDRRAAFGMHCKRASSGTGMALARASMVPSRFDAVFALLGGGGEADDAGTEGRDASGVLMASSPSDAGGMGCRRREVQ